MSIEVKKLKNVNDGKTYDIWTFNNRPLYYLTKNEIPVQVCNDEFCEKWPAVKAPEELPEGFIDVDGNLRTNLRTILPEFNPIFLDPIINPSYLPIPSKTGILQIPTNFPEFKRGIEVYTFDDDDNTSQSFNGDGLTEEGNYVWRVLTGPEDNEDEDGLTGGQIAGIVLLALGGLGLLIFIIMLIVNSTKKKKKVKFNFMSFQDFIRNN